MGPLEPVDLLRVEISKFRLRHLKEQKKCTDKEFEPLRPIFTELSHYYSVCQDRVLFFYFLIFVILPRIFPPLFRKGRLRYSFQNWQAGRTHSGAVCLCFFRVQPLQNPRKPRLKKNLEFLYLHCFSCNNFTNLVNKFLS